MVSRRSYLVCATQRSGSTLLCELLKDTGVAGRPEEYFEARHETGLPPHPGDFLKDLPRTGAGIRDDLSPPAAPPHSSLQGLSSYREHLERTFRLGTTPNGVFGAKLMWSQLDELHTLASQLPEYTGLRRFAMLERMFDGPRYVRVTRHDKVRQAVSMWRALQTRAWRRERGLAERGPGVYRFEGIDHLVRTLQEEDAWWGAFFEGRARVLSISYEDDLELDRDTTVRRVLDHVGVPVPEGWHAAEPMARQADSVSDEWVAAYHEDVARRGEAEPVARALAR